MAINTYTPTANSVIHRMCLDFNNDYHMNELSPGVINLNQSYDTGRIFEASIYDEGIKYQFPDNATEIFLSIYFKYKNRYETNALGISSDKDKVYFQFDENVLADHGVANTILYIKTDTGNISIMGPMIVVHPIGEEYIPPEPPTPPTPAGPEDYIPIDGNLAKSIGGVPVV